MGLCGRYDFADPPVSYRVVPFYFKEDDLLPHEIHLFDRTVLGYFVDAGTVKVGQRCRVRPMINLAKHLFATLEIDYFADSLQGRFQIWLEHKPDVTYDAALDSFLPFIGDNISKPKEFRSTEFTNDLDQAIQYRTFSHEKKLYLAIQPRIESAYLPPYQKPEFFKIKDSMNFERFQVHLFLNKGNQTFWYENIHDFYSGGGHGFPTRSTWGPDGPVFEAFTETGWLPVHPYESYLTKRD